MSRYQRDKGIRFDLDNVHAFAEAMPGAKVRRGLQARSGEEVPDVDADPFWVECKVGKKQSPRAALRQALADADIGRIPLAVIKDDYQEPFVVIRREDFLEIVAQWWRDRR